MRGKAVKVAPARNAGQTSQSGQHRPIAARAHRVELPPDGIARDYGQLVALLAQARKSRRISQECLDDLSGLQDGYVAKLERPETQVGRAAVHQSFDLWIGGLKVGLRIVLL